MSLSIRELGLNDRLMLEELLDVCGPGWSDHLAPGASGPLAFIADSRSFAFGAYIDNEPVGWIWGAHVRRPDGRTMSSVHEIDVVESRRRTGVGSSLVEAAVGLARRNGSHALLLVTGADNEPAQAFCEACGALPVSEAGERGFSWEF